MSIGPHAKSVLFVALLLLSVCGCQPSTGADSCQYANDGECDDGRLGALTSVCDPGTDETDCANVDPTVCLTTDDGYCDDGRPGAESSKCAAGTDEADCGP